MFSCILLPIQWAGFCKMHLENLGACRGVRYLPFAEILSLLTFLLTMFSVSWLHDIQVPSRTRHQCVGIKVCDKRVDSKELNIAIKIQQTRRIRIKSQLLTLLKNLRDHIEKLQRKVSETLYRKWKSGLCPTALKTLYLS